MEIVCLDLEGVLVPEIWIAFAEETGIPELSDCSVITAPYRVGRGHMGTIGVVGPMRMNYARVMDTLTLVSRELTGMLSVDALEA